MLDKVSCSLNIFYCVERSISVVICDIDVTPWYVSATLKTVKGKGGAPLEIK
jgi:hypothetical protein